jgi:hypothetical protein
MIYKFKSKATGDVIMTGPIGDRVLRAMGREPTSQGIFEASALDSLLAALQRSITTEELGAAKGGGGSDASANEDTAQRLGLKERAWPLMEMMKRSLGAGADITWGA